MYRPISLIPDTSMMRSLRTMIERMFTMCGIFVLMVPNCCGLVPTNRSIIQDTLWILDQVKISYNEIVLLGSDRFPRELVPRFGTRSLKVNGKFMTDGSKHSRTLSLWFVNSVAQVESDCDHIIPIAVKTKIHKASLVIGTTEELVPAIVICLGHLLSIDSSVFFATYQSNETELLFTEAYRASSYGDASTSKLGILQKEQGCKTKFKQVPYILQ